MSRRGSSQVLPEPDLEGQKGSSRPGSGDKMHQSPAQPAAAAAILSPAPQIQGWNKKQMSPKGDLGSGRLDISHRERGGGRGGPAEGLGRGPGLQRTVCTSDGRAPRPSVRPLAGPAVPIARARWGRTGARGLWSNTQAGGAGPLAGGARPARGDVGAEGGPGRTA
jgi:hypothetical protein